MLEKIWFWVIVISIIIVGIVIISESTKSIENKQNYRRNYPKTQEITETETPWNVASEIFKLQAKGKIPDYEILKWDAFDAPIKTEVDLWILIKGEFTNWEIKELLKLLYRKIKLSNGTYAAGLPKDLSESGESMTFRWHTRPTNIYIYAYTSLVKYYKGGENWKAMLDWVENLNVEPNISLAN
uniref:Uncharacterized protein n=1 Tax=candidate division WOR-3 bacterium TaxID=2052148 RepID=A0A7C6EBK2_UNCW3